MELLRRAGRQFIALGADGTDELKQQRGEHMPDQQIGRTGCRVWCGSPVRAEKLIVVFQHAANCSPSEKVAKLMVDVLLVPFPIEREFGQRLLRRLKVGELLAEDGRVAAGRQSPHDLSQTLAIRDEHFGRIVRGE